MRMQSKFSLALMAMGFCLLLSGCNRGSSDSDETGDSAGQASSSSQEVGVSDDEIVFGTHTDLTGPIAFYGADSVNGARMRFDEANEAGGVHGRKIRFVVEDTRYEVPNSIRAADKLINLDKIFAMYLALGTPNNLAVMQDQFEAGIPNLFPITGSIKMAEADEGFEQYERLMFSQRGIYYYETRAAVRYFTETQNRTTPCVAHVDNDFGHEILVGAEDEAEALELEIAAVTAHRSTETEFTASVLRLRDAGCDLVLMGTVATDTIGILSMAKEIGWEDVDFVGSNAGASFAVAEQESGAGEGYFAFSHMSRIYPDTSENETAVEWFNRYVERFGKTPDATGMEGYRGADLIVIALEKAGRDLTREKFVAALETIGEYDDIFGYKLQFSPDNHNGVKEIVLMQVQNGRWVEMPERVMVN